MALEHFFELRPAVASRHERLNDQAASEVDVDRDRADHRGVHQPMQEADRVVRLYQPPGVFCIDQRT